MAGATDCRGVALVVPCYEEEDRLEPARFLEFLAACPGARLLFVDDGSRDGTWRVLEAIQDEAPGQVDLLRLERNQGKAEAVRRGVNQLFGTDAAYVGYWDADLAAPLSLVPDFLEVLVSDPTCALVMGARVRLLGRTISRNAARHYLGRVFSTAASLALRMPVYDTQCGAKLFRPEDGVRAAFARPFDDPWLFDVEILARLRAAWGLEAVERIVELPLRTWTAVPGSKVRLRDGARAMAGLARVWARGRRSAKTPT